MKSIRACLFDMDGVIVDTAKFHFLAWQRLAESLSISFGEAENEQLKGVSRVDSLEMILRWGGLTLNNEKKLELMDLKNRWYLDYAEAVSPSDLLPGVLHLLQALKSAQVKIGLGSSSKNAIMILDRLGIHSYFDVIIDGNKTHLSKPHPEVFERGARELQLSPDEIVVFEDASSGVAAAKAGGFACIGIGDQKVLSAADAVVSDLDGMTLERMHTLLIGHQ
ncbi:MAG: beta-phosphoglucomutase [Flavobacteriales bacterium]